MCTGCLKFRNVSLPKYFYKADCAQREYEGNVSAYKRGPRMNPFNCICYIDGNHLSIKNIDLKRKVAHKQRYTSKPKAKPINYDYLTGRTFKEFQTFLMENPTANIWQMDTIEGIKGKDQKAVLSLLHTKTNLQLYFLINSISIECVTQVFDDIKRYMGDDCFKETFEVILTDCINNQ